MCDINHGQHHQLRRIRKIKDAFPLESSIFDIIQSNNVSSTSASEDKECINLFGFYF